MLLVARTPPNCRPDVAPGYSLDTPVLAHEMNILYSESIFFDEPGFLNNDSIFYLYLEQLLYLVSTLDNSRRHIVNDSQKVILGL